MSREGDIHCGEWQDSTSKGSKSILRAEQGGLRQRHSGSNASTGASEERGRKGNVVTGGNIERPFQARSRSIKVRVGRAVRLVVEVAHVSVGGRLSVGADVVTLARVRVRS